MFDLKEFADGVSFKIKVQPKASKNQICGLIGDALKLRITAPPVDGAANEAVVKYFASFFKVSRSQIEILSGHTGRNKVIKINGVTIEQAIQLFPFAVSNHKFL